MMVCYIIPQGAEHNLSYACLNLVLILFTGSLLCPTVGTAALSKWEQWGSGGGILFCNLGPPIAEDRSKDSLGPRCFLTMHGRCSLLLRGWCFGLDSYSFPSPCPRPDSTAHCRALEAASSSALSLRGGTPCLHRRVPSVLRLGLSLSLVVPCALAYVHGAYFTGVVFYDVLSFVIIAPVLARVWYEIYSALPYGHQRFWSIWGERGLRHALVFVLDPATDLNYKLLTRCEEQTAALRRQIEPLFSPTAYGARISMAPGRSPDEEPAARVGQGSSYPIDRFLFSSTSTDRWSKRAFACWSGGRAAPVVANLPVLPLPFFSAPATTPHVLPSAPAPPPPIFFSAPSVTPLTSSTSMTPAFSVPSTSAPSTRPLALFTKSFRDRNKGKATDHGGPASASAAQTTVADEEERAGTGSEPDAKRIRR
ncbi:hypothetical protein M427DRAFT_142874 [Gonapodya prolifera JEL478]|uniref:Uncharacterized protein n=1 Tax=Gonapodya prolifera (strain JEL478) TaxID=1344416 RepID=A0A139ATE8_GONPJ|nr:hypothetical protein M427DRAFT_142874 [Gonapodya prolifera JEL478]|eukprot:KXS20007.1 hypothetical protein M427DRAFT_142874 [Gonapodya prolifera JEL478]